MSATVGCGPGLLLLGGGSAGVALGLDGGDDGGSGGSGGGDNANVAPAVIINALVREESPARVQFTLIDANSDACSVQLEYSRAGGPFTPCTAASGAPPVTGLASSPAGETHEFLWNYLADLGPQLQPTLSLRMRANDGSQFGTWFLLSGLATGNDGPELRNVTMIGDTGVILVTFDVVDANSDLADVSAAWSIDQAQSFTPIDPQTEMLGNPPVNLLSSPSGSPGQFIWNSAVALGNYTGPVWLRLDAVDLPGSFTTKTPGPPVVAGPFPIQNSANQPPTVAVATDPEGFTYVARVPLDITLRDADSDAVTVAVRYTLDGTQFHNATLVGHATPGTAGPFATAPSPVYSTIQWDARADLATQPELNTAGAWVALEIAASDTRPGNTVRTERFRVLGNSAPEVLAVSVLNNSGTIPVVVRLRDASGDPAGVDIAFSTDGVAFQPLAQSDFVVGDLNNLAAGPNGDDNLLVWDSTLRFNGTGANAPRVFLRVTPTDSPLSVTPPLDLTGWAYTSNAFDVINNGTATVPAALESFTLSGAQPANPQFATVEFAATRALDRTILPASATGFDTFWQVVEGPGYGSLRRIGGASLNFPVGSIQPNAPAQILEGDTFRLSDGINPPVTFRFNKGAPIVLPTANVTVNITGLNSASQVASAIASEINGLSGFLLAASSSGPTVTLTHRLGCRVGNSVAVGGAALNIVFDNSCLTSVINLNGGQSAAQIEYLAPAVAPPGANGVTLRCTIDNGSHLNVFVDYRLYWGAEPQSVILLPSNPAVAVGGTVQLNPIVQPAAAPQVVTWEVDGGAANGTVDAAGVFHAPATMPAASQIVVRAISALPGVFGGTLVSLLPRPAGVVVDSAGGVANLALSTGAPSTLAFSAQLQPFNAQPEIAWRIFWRGEDQGGGNAAVGTINASGLYTAPQVLPSPDVVFVQAVSASRAAVFGEFKLRLEAPAPTSFQIAPGGAITYAGGAGLNFQALSFAPAGANQAVTWELIPAFGYGTISPQGRYTPPDTGIAAQVTVRARSTVDPGVFATTTLNLQPAQSTTPSQLNVTPPVSISAGGPVQLVAALDPPESSQAVVWAVVGPGARGSIDADGRYTPAVSATDYIDMVRCTSTVNPQLFTEVELRVCGTGQGVAAQDDMPTGRAGASPVWDSVSGRLWLVGGASEQSRPGADFNVMWFEPASNSFGHGPTITGIAPLGTQPPGITGVFDPVQQRLYAFVGQPVGAPRVFYLPVSPAPASNWVEVAAPGGTDVPSMPQARRYPAWFDTSTNLIYLLTGPTHVHRFNAALGLWGTRQVLNQPFFAPANPLNNAFTWNQATREAFFVGPAGDAINAANRVHVLDAAGSRWLIRAATGDNPAVGQADGALSYRAGSLWWFGGRDVATGALNNNVYQIALGAQAAFTRTTASGDWPAARSGAAFAFSATGTDPVLFGGANATGVFGDAWQFTEATRLFRRADWQGLRPQGRSGAAGVWHAGSGYVYGGSCDHGPSNDLWRLNGGEWSPVVTTGARPPALTGASAVLDAAAGRMFLFGGRTATAGTSAVYVLNLATGAWTLNTPGGGPPSGRSGAAVAAQLDGGGSVIGLWVFGGLGPSGLLNDLWRLNLASGLPGTWQQVTTTGSRPDPRQGATLAWDGAESRLLLLGGESANSGPNRQLAAFNVAASQWTSLEAAQGTRPAHASGAVWDGAFRRFIHAPARRAQRESLVVAVSGPEWQQLSPSASNHARGGTGLFDAANGRYYVVFGDRPTGTRMVGTNGLRSVEVKP